jgi:hypothetical protein
VQQRQRQRCQHTGGGQLGGGDGSLASEQWWWRQHNQQSTESIGSYGIRNGNDDNNNNNNYNEGTCSLVAAWRQRGGQNGGITAVAAALLQHGVSGGSTFNNQLKNLVATATEMVTMIAMTMKIKTKVKMAAW